MVNNGSPAGKEEIFIGNFFQILLLMVVRIK